MARAKSNENIGRPIEYDPDFHGPRKRRSCTDVPCLLVFLSIIIAWGGIAYYALANGDPSSLLVPADSTGLRCGYDEKVKNRPYLFFFDVTKCLDITSLITGCDTPQVCVESCPQDIFYNGSSTNLSVALPYCQDYEGLLESYDVALCPQWYLPSDSVQYRCIPLLSGIESSKLQDWAEQISDGSDPSSFLTKITDAIENIKLLSNIEQFTQQIIADLVQSWALILVAVVLGVFACMIYIALLRWIAGVMVWLSIGGALAGLAAADYFSYYFWQQFKNDYNLIDPTPTLKYKRDLLLATFIICCIVSGIVCLILLFLRKRIILAIALIVEGSKAVASVVAALFFPIVPWILQLANLLVFGVVAMYLASTGEPYYQYRNVTDACTAEQNFTVWDSCTPSNFSGTALCANATCRYIGISNSTYYPYLQFLNFFAFLWVAFFISALNQMVLAQVFAEWYWTMHKRDLPFFALTAAVGRTVRYHLGTLAFGSLIITICRMIRIVLEYIDRKTKQYDNAFVKAIMCCLKCFFWCLEKFLKFINKNAYIMCAIHGKNFCISAKDAFWLLMRNIVRVFVLDKITDFLFFLSKLLLTAGVGCVSYVVLYFCLDTSELNYIMTPVVATMIICYMVISLFFSVYSTAVATLFLCFLEDIERNDGKTRPYYMSRNLMKIFGKRNKGPKIQ